MPQLDRQNEEKRMGLFDFLFSRKRRRKTIPDLIWRTTAAKFEGLKSDIDKEWDSGVAGIVLVAHFPEVYDSLLAIADELSTSVAVCLANELTAESTCFESFSEIDTVSILVAERHPLRSHDDTIVDLAESLPWLCRTKFFLSLEDPLLREFMPPWVSEMLHKLGLKENEAIESRMVVRQIETTQRKMATTCIGDSLEESAAEWLQVNTPEDAQR
jgi:hypothetical protein